MKALRLMIPWLLFNTLTTVAQPTIQNNFNCFTLVAGKGVTADGSVILAHNEDDYGEQIVNWLVIPAKDYEANASINARHGATIPQASHTLRTIWFDMPGMDFSDCYLNQHGVTIVSNACPSREDSASLTDGGLTWELRQIMAQRATSARHAVKIAAELISHFGYASSGRTYTIADPEEAWMLSVVNGKHFIALRVPDNAVAVLPNFYTIREVNMNDTARCIASPDLISYAIQRGWYHPETDGKFNFREAYGAPSSLTHPVNIKRMWGGINLLSSQFYEMESEFPWAIAPHRKVTVEWFANILGSHYEGTPLDLTDSYTKGHPHSDSADAICASHTQYGFVAQLRNWMPVEIGAMLWMIPRRPCIQAMIPVYCGTDSFPSDFSTVNSQEAQIRHFDRPENLREAFPEHIYWQFSRVADSADSNYLRRARQIGPEALKFNRELLLRQEDFELDVMSLHAKDPKAAARTLGQYTEEVARRWLAITREILETQPPQW